MNKFRIGSKAILSRTIEHDVDISLSGTDIANLFWQLGADEQARFFNKLGRAGSFVFQLQAITDDKNLNGTGRMCMSRIGEYAEKQL